jgi:hypothetical protein
LYAAGRVEEERRFAALTAGLVFGTTIDRTTADEIPKANVPAKTAFAVRTSTSGHALASTQFGARMGGLRAAVVDIHGWFRQIH